MSMNDRSTPLPGASPTVRYPVDAVALDVSVLLRVGAILLVACLVVGCATGPQQTVRDHGPDRERAKGAAGAGQDADERDVDEAATDLATLAQRDVEAFLKSREEAQANRETALEPADDDEIVWNEPTDTRPRAVRPVDLTDAEDGFEPELLARPEEDVAVQKEEVDEVPGLIEDFKEGADPRDRLHAMIVDLSRELYREAAYADMPLRELFLIAATTLVDPDRALEPDAIPGLTQRERDVLREFQNFFAQLGRGLDGSREADEVIDEAVDTLRRSLSTDPELTLGTLALCTRVGGFGDYTEFNRYAFLAHSEQQAVVYIEIDGFTSERNERGEWVTELAQQLVIYSDRDGIPVWREDWQTAVDRTRNRRSDFFVVQVITIPNALSVGKYHLKIRVRDEKSGAEAEGSIPFEMVADPRLAATVR